MRRLEEREVQVFFPDPFCRVHGCGCVPLPLQLWGPSSMIQLSLGSYKTFFYSFRPMGCIVFLLVLASGSFNLSCGFL